MMQRLCLNVDSNTSLTWITTSCSGNASRLHPPYLTMQVHPMEKTMWMYTGKPGMGIEPTYNSSAGT
jgi:hypothetical protein